MTGVMPTPPFLLWVKDAWTWWVTYHWYVMGASGVFCLVMMILGRHRRQTMTKVSTSWGSSRWATIAEVKRAGLLRGRGIVLGAMGAEILRSSRGSHGLIFAPSQYGKTTTCLVNTILLNDDDDLVILDVKGELYDITARHRSTLGPVYRFNPTDATTDTLNPKDLIRWGGPHEVADVQRQNQQISAPEAPPTQATEWWRGEASNVLFMVDLALKDRSTYAVYPQSMAGQLQFLTDPAYPMAVQLDRLAQHPDPLVQIARQRFMNYSANKRVPSQKCAEIWASASGLLGLWQDPMVAHATNTSRVDVTSFQQARTPQTLYLQVSAEDLKGRQKPLFRILWQAMLSRWIDRPVNAYRRRLFIVLDEFSAMGHIQSIEDVFALVAGYGIRVLGALQSLHRLWDAYGKNTGILSNAQVRIVYAANDWEEAEAFARMLGTATVQDTAARVDHGWRRGASESTSSHARPLLTAGEIMDLPSHQGLVRFPGIKPILVTKVHYLADRRFASRV